MIDAIIRLLGAAWVFRKWFLTKKGEYILISAALLAFQLSYWPLFMDPLISWGVILVSAVTVSTIEYKKTKQVTGKYVYVLICIGLIGVLTIYFFFHKYLI